MIILLIILFILIDFLVIHFEIKFNSALFYAIHHQHIEYILEKVYNEKPVSKN